MGGGGTVLSRREMLDHTHTLAHYVHREPTPHPRSHVGGVGVEAARLKIAPGGSRGCS